MLTSRSLSANQKIRLLTRKQLVLHMLKYTYNFEEKNSRSDFIKLLRKEVLS